MPSGWTKLPLQLFPEKETRDVLTTIQNRLNDLEGLVSGSFTQALAQNSPPVLSPIVVDASLAGFLRSNVSDNYEAGTLTFDSGTTLSVSSGSTINVVSGATFNFDQTTGTSPFTVDSTTVVTNLNADTVDGLSGAQFLRSDADDTGTGSYTLSAFVPLKLTDSIPAIEFGNGGSQDDLLLDGQATTSNVVNITAPSGGGSALVLTSATTGSFISSTTLTIRSVGAALTLETISSGNVIITSAGTVTFPDTTAFDLSTHDPTVTWSDDGATAATLTLSGATTVANNTVSYVFDNAGGASAGTGTATFTVSDIATFLTFNKATIITAIGGITLGTTSWTGAAVVTVATGVAFNFDQTTGTSPFTVDSTTVVTNLNADRVDGVNAGSFLRSDASDNYTSGTLTFDATTTLHLLNNVNLAFGSGSDAVFDWDTGSSSLRLDMGGNGFEFDVFIDDPFITFNGSANSGVITWDDDLNQFDVAQDLKFTGFVGVGTGFNPGDFNGKFTVVQADTTANKIGLRFIVTSTGGSGTHKGFTGFCQSGTSSGGGAAINFYGGETIGSFRDDSNGFQNLFGINTTASIGNLGGTGSTCVGSFARCDLNDLTDSGGGGQTLTTAACFRGQIELAAAAGGTITNLYGLQIVPVLGASHTTTIGSFYNIRVQNDPDTTCDRWWGIAIDAFAGTVNNDKWGVNSGEDIQISTDKYLILEGSQSVKGDTRIRLDSGAAAITFEYNATQMLALNATSVQMNDNINLTFGTGSDALIFYDGTDLIIDPSSVGSGTLEIRGIKMTLGDGTTAGDPTITFDGATVNGIMFWDDSSDQFQFNDDVYFGAHVGIFGANPHAFYPLVVVKNSGDNTLHSIDVQANNTQTSTGSVFASKGVVCQANLKDSVLETSKRGEAIGGEFFARINASVTGPLTVVSGSVIGGKFTADTSDTSTSITFPNFFAAQFKTTIGSGFTASTVTTGYGIRLESSIAGANSVFTTAYGIFILPPTNTGASASYGDYTGMWIGDLQDANVTGTNYAIRIDDQNGSNKAATNGNIQFVGGGFDTGHIQLDTGHIWNDSSTLRFLGGGAPGSATDSRLDITATGVIINEQGEAANFRIESDTDAEIVFVNGTSNRVGISTNAPDTLFHVLGASHLEGNVEVGLFYMEFDDIAAPGAGAVGTRRLFVDTATGELSVRTSAATTVSLEAGAGGGETNTGSNVGTDGVGVFDGKVVADLQFRHVAPGSTKITTTLNGNDIDIDVVEANLTISNLGGTLQLTDLSDVNSTTGTGAILTFNDDPQFTNAVTTTGQFRTTAGTPSIEIQNAASSMQCGTGSAVTQEYTFTGEGESDNNELFSWVFDNKASGGTSDLAIAINETDITLTATGATLTLTTPTIAATGWTNANHTHAGATTGGTVAISDTTGTLAIARGGTGQTAQTAAFDALGPGTTKGDVLVHNGSDHIRLAVGSNNQVLTADSAEASGVKWAAGGAGVSAVSMVQATGLDQTVSKGDTSYIGLGGSGAPALDEASSQWQVEMAGSFDKLRAYISVNSTGAAGNTMTIRKGGVDTTLTVTWNSGETGEKEDTSNSFTVVAGDLISIEQVNTGSGGGTKNITVESVSMRFTPS